MLKSTVIMKTDMVKSSERTRTLSGDELGKLLNEHKDMVVALVEAHDGHIVKGEGDAFWITFPSVTAAAQTALKVQETLRQSQTSKTVDKRLAIRIAITLGDVLHQDDDIFGHTVNLTARIESIAPPDEIYLSQSAWLALNHAEIETSLVGTFELKGMGAPQQIYKVVSKNKITSLHDCVIVFSDLVGFTAFSLSRTPDKIADALIMMDDLLQDIVPKHNGVVRLNLGDGYVITFNEAAPAIAAISQFQIEWNQYIANTQSNIPAQISIHQGDLHIFRSYVFSLGLNETAIILGHAKKQLNKQAAIIVSSVIYDAIKDTEWESKMQALDIPEEKIEDLGPIYALAI